jgi:hypothetical protein
MGRPDARDLCAAEAGAGAGLSGIVPQGLGEAGDVRLHKEDPATYIVERLAKDFRVMRHRVHAILWLKEMEEEEERKRGQPLDNSIEILLDSCPEYVK